MLQSDLCLISRHPVCREKKYEYTKTCLKVIWKDQIQLGNNVTENQL
jgi:hypothetical protein